MTPFDATERLDAESAGRLVDAKLVELVALAQARSPFWREQLGDARVSGRGDLAALPVLHKDTWMAAGPPHSEANLTRPLGDAYVFRSGGSTGDPKFSVFSTEEFRRFVTYFLRSYQAAGLAPTDRVANLFACGSLYASFVFVNRMLEELGALNFPFTAACPADVVARHVRLFGINTLLGFPSWLLQVAGALAEDGLRIEKIFYAGEHLYDEERRYLHETLGATVIASAGYGAVDTGLMGYQCPHATGGVHHVLADHTYLEFVDPETLQPVPDGHEGLLLVTNLDRTLQPILRYNIGDMGRLIPEPCACGRTAPRFELLRRGDDVLRIGYANVTYDEMAAVIAGVPGLSATVQMVKRREGMRDQLGFRFEVADPGAMDPVEVAALLTARISAAKPDIGKLFATEYIHPLHLEFLPPGGIPRLPVTGKFKRTVDLS